MRSFTRRHFLAGSTAAAAASLLASRCSFGQDPVVDFAAESAHGVREQVAWMAEPFPLADLRLLPGIFYSQQEINRAYLHSLDSDSLLWSFRKTAGLAAPGTPYGGWEAPDCELRGHFNGGHYLSAVALTYASTGDEGLRDKGNALVAELAKRQAANANGYLSAFPEDFFDRLRREQQVWAPFYTIHKILAGNIDMYVYCGNQQALANAEGLANWINHWAEGISDAQLARILKTEYGGTMEGLLNLYALTGNKQYLSLSHRFEQEQFFGPLAAHRDELKGLHANTHVPKVIGAARRYELTGEDKYRQISEFFWNQIVNERAYATGGTSNFEFWRTDPGELGGELSLDSEECCVGYNMLKLSRHIFGWTTDPRVMDYYERVLFNSRLGTQDAQGLKMYYLPLAAGYWKYFNSPTHSFWCCTGTGAEEFAKFSDSIYFHDDNSVYVNLFIASEVNWKQKGIRLRQETSFPEEQGTRLTIRAAQPTELALQLRIPYWATQGGAVKINGEVLPVFARPSSYLTLKRLWRDGDRVELSVPMQLHSSRLPGDRTMQAAMYGPLVLAVRMGNDGLTREMQYDTTGKNIHPPGDPKPTPAPELPSTDAAADIAPGGTALTFVTTAGEHRELIPLYRISGERYAVYLKTQQS
ncbi:MAG: glycoside hydrolase family 127 protein [Acidobacteriaceae bacterium]|nr:glycoside hydrolase family 127 protein [Acidobacteriaceae bacterium]